MWAASAADCKESEGVAEFMQGAMLDSFKSRNSSRKAGQQHTLSYREQELNKRQPSIHPTVTLNRKQ